MIFFYEKQRPNFILLLHIHMYMYIWQNKLNSAAKRPSMQVVKVEGCCASQIVDDKWCKIRMVEKMQMHAFHLCIKSQIGQ